MGWASGSYFADEVWAVVKPHVNPSDQRRVARELIQVFCGQDADDWCDQQILEDAGHPTGEYTKDWDERTDKFWAELRS